MVLWQDGHPASNAGGVNVLKHFIRPMKVLWRAMAVAQICAAGGCGNRTPVSQTIIRGMWVSSISRGPGYGINSYRTVEKYPHWAVASRRIRAQSETADIELETVVRQIRFDFHEAYQANRMTSYDPKLARGQKKAFNPTQILLKLYDWVDSPNDPKRLELRLTLFVGDADKVLGRSWDSEWCPSDVRKVGDYYFSEIELLDETAPEELQVVRATYASALESRASPAVDADPNKTQ